MYKCYYCGYYFKNFGDRDLFMKFIIFELVFNEFI